MKEIYNVLEDLFRRCLKKSNVFSFYFERYESKSLALKTPNQNTSIWVFLKQIMLVGKCRLLKLLCNRLFYSKSSKEIDIISTIEGSVLYVLIATILCASKLEIEKEKTTLL